MMSFIQRIGNVRVMKNYKVPPTQLFVIIIFLLSGACGYSFGQDSFEVDDTYLQANVIVLDYPTGQQHTIHHIDDVDWVKFYALEGVTYMISTSGMDAFIELYDTDGQTYIDGLWSENFSFDYLSWECPPGGEGIYYVNISYGGALEDLDGAAYTLTIDTYFGFGLPPLLTGFIKNTHNQVVPNARIKLSPKIILPYADDRGSGISLENGSFVLSVKLEGIYTVTISANGHRTLVQQNVSIPGNRTFWLTRLNSSPVAVKDLFSCLVGGSVTGNVLQNDTDSDGDSLVAVLDSGVSSGTIAFKNTGEFTYTHHGNGTASDSFTYHVNDGTSSSATVTVDIIIQPRALSFLMLLLQAID